MPSWRAPGFPIKHFDPPERSVSTSRRNQLRSARAAFATTVANNCIDELNVQYRWTSKQHAEPFPSRLQERLSDTIMSAARRYVSCLPSGQRGDVLIDPEPFLAEPPAVSYVT